MLENQCKAEQGQGGNKAKGEGQDLLPQGEGKQLREVADIVYVAVAANFITLPERGEFSDQQKRVVGGLGAHVVPGFFEKEDGIFSPVGVASSARPADQFQPGLPGTNLRGFRVVGVVADKEVDAAVPGDEDEFVAEQIVPQGYGRNGQQQPRAY